MNNLSHSRLPATNQTISVVFVGSHLTFSKHALRLLQAEHPEIRFLRVCSLRDLSETVALRGQPFLTVLDEETFLPLMDDHDALMRLSSGSRLTLAYRDPKTAQTLIAQSCEIEALNDVGVLPLNAELEVWLSMFNLLLCGEVLYPRAVMGAIQEPTSIDHAALPNVRLTPREWEVLELVAEGKQNKIIAAGLDLSEHTVKLHVHNVLKKLGVSNRTCAAGWLANHGPAS